MGDLTKNQVKIKFDVATACGYVSGNSIKAIVTGASVCGDPVPTVVKTSSAVSISGAVATTQYAISETGPNSFSTCGANGTITVNVINTGTTNPPINDSLTINLSNGLSYVAGSFVSIKNAPSPLAPVQNGNLLRWRIPSTVAPSDSMKFTINLSASSAGCGFNTLDLYATQSIALSCGATTCSTPVITGRLISDTITTICCVDMQVSKTVTPSPVAAGATAFYTVAVYNAGPGTATNVVVNDVLPTGVTYVSNTTTRGTWSAPDWTIPSMAAGQRDTIKFTVTANNATTSAITVCNTAFVKSINSSTPEVNLLNDTSKVCSTINPNCTGVNAGVNQVACGNTSTTITGTPTTGTWTALGANPTGATLGATAAGIATVNFTAAANGNYDFIFTDGSCKDTMRVVVTAKPNAGIDKLVDCFANGIATMTATGTGTWTAQAGNPGTATITTPTSATTTINNFSVAGTYSFIYTNNGCTDTVSIVVGSACTCPIANNAITTASSTQCAPFAGITIDGTTATPLTNTSYQWQVNANGAGWSNAATTEDYATGFLAAGVYQYRRIFIHTGVPVCRDTTAAITITVNAKPNAGTDIANACSGQYFSLTGTPNTGTWSWNTSNNPVGGSIISQSNGVANVYLERNYPATYSFIYTATNGCKDTMTISEIQRPWAGNDKFYDCGTQPVTDTLRGTDPTSGGTWSALSTNAAGITLGSTTSGAAAISLPAAPTQGTWNFIYTAPNGCTDTMTVTIGVNGVPSLVVNMGTNPICKNGTVQLCPNPWGWSNYQWYKNGVAIAAPKGTGACITLDSRPSKTV